MRIRQGMFGMLAAMALLAGPVRGNDSVAVMEAGGLRLVRDAPVELLAETLFVSAGKITVDYDFRSAEQAGTTTLVAFPLPDYDLAWEGADRLGGPGDSVSARIGFRVWSDGQELYPALEIKALRNGIDITRLLESYGIPVGSLDYDMVMAALRAVPQEGRAELERLGAARWYDGSDPAPLWTIHASYYWTQDFPAGKTVHIRHEYSPMAGAFFVGGPDFVEFDPADYCMSQGEISALRKKLAGAPYGMLLATNIRYILTTGANWRGPIGTFHLILDKGSTDNQISLCFKGIEKTGPTRFEATVKDFTPGDELDVMIFAPPE
ncbi:DUF4424 domain-containing protein [Frigidibacter sp. ROC022]|uniref:DUF4424 domain-containing protein n=1 Tax=Frigidibacter sp. ROC022 TaxID=2971796 RepID=UPI00215A261D|nr:DUF4424 domain-containing protein [Frigidibacter sp. ROC022]MCR8725360.1 DUF4424 domain-containing protein [Frigidibacter sp. ROC022]